MPLSKWWTWWHCIQFSSTSLRQGHRRQMTFYQMAQRPAQNQRQHYQHQQQHQQKHNPWLTYPPSIDPSFVCFNVATTGHVAAAAAAVLQENWRERERESKRKSILLLLFLSCLPLFSERARISAFRFRSVAVFLLLCALNKNYDDRTTVVGGGGATFSTNTAEAHIQDHWLKRAAAAVCDSRQLPSGRRINEWMNEKMLLKSFCNVTANNNSNNQVVQPTDAAQVITLPLPVTDTIAQIRNGDAWTLDCWCTFLLQPFPLLTRHLKKAIRSRKRVRSRRSKCAIY